VGNCDDLAMAAVRDMAMLGLDGIGDKLRPAGWVSVWWWRPGVAGEQRLETVSLARFRFWLSISKFCSRTVARTRKHATVATRAQRRGMRCKSCRRLSIDKHKQRPRL
jgi:hypothetical protein